MKKILLALLLIPFVVVAQRQTEYNRKGDEAMRQMDYPIAKFWYEEGVQNCDRYSIDQLTSIWMTDQSMHISMGPVMNKCLNCLAEAATERRDTLAMKKLIIYYQEGIGIVSNEASAVYWKEQLDQLRNPFFTIIGSNSNRPKDRMKFFMGYNASLVAPFGIQFGAMNENWGFYIRFQTNMSFQNDFQAKCVDGENGGGVIPEFDHDDKKYDFLKENGTKAEKDEKIKGKSTTLIGTAGFMFKAFPNVYLSVGAGYAKRDVFYRYGEIDPAESKIHTNIGWAKNTDISLDGVALDVGATVKFAGQFYGTLGCTFLNFKKVTSGIGIGFIFN
jgi:hypothetical protein